MIIFQQVNLLAFTEKNQCCKTVIQLMKVPMWKQLFDEYREVKQPVRMAEVLIL